MAVGDRFAALSLHDLLEAREAYHVHLLRQRNVVATAVGRYLQRVDEDESRTLAERLALPPGERPPRTLDRVEITHDSWPCVLVFVDHWMTADEIRTAPDEMVPRRLYLPDGRTVPTCVIYAPPAAAAAADAPLLNFPSRLLGGGYACLSDVQGRERVGSVGCLVSDGLKTYALTNRHVAGEPGTQLHTLRDGATVPIGVSAARSAGRLGFEQAYPGLPGSRMEVAIDAGLIELDDVREWTTQVFGVGQLSEMRDLGPEALSLDLIGTPVRAFGAASGALQGQLLALFHRYRARSGVEHVADAVVGPRPGDEPLRTRPGDSGTLWVVDDGASTPATGAPAPPVQPLALEWGGERFAGEQASGSDPYALVTFLSTACRALDVEPVFDWNTGHELYWGEVGHYTIGARACDLVAPDALRDFFVANRERISFDLQAIVAGDYRTPRGTAFYPLSDVPDRVWKQRTRGMVRPHEGPNHFADMDDPLDGGPTLLDLFAQDPETVAPATWIDFYVRKGMTPRNMGLLPFRVAQLYRTIVDALGDDDDDSALAAAGVMSHYVGDACQPLHASRFHDGRTPDEEGVHEAYETRMVGDHSAEIVAGLDTVLAGAPPAAIVSGHEAAGLAVVELMQRTFTRLPPETICDAFRRSHRSDDLWAALGEATIACIADGCQTLAGLWSSAWEEAGAAAPPARARDRDELVRRYLDPDFAPSLYLPELASAMPWKTAAPAVG
jgi:hypothetical protein